MQNVIHNVEISGTEYVYTKIKAMSSADVSEISRNLKISVFVPELPKFREIDAFILLKSSMMSQYRLNFMPIILKQQ